MKKHTPWMYFAILLVAWAPSTALAESPRTEPSPTVPPSTPTYTSPLRIVVDGERPEVRRGLQERAPIRCSGEEELTLSGVRIDSEGDALVVKGDCRVFITRSHLRGGQSAVRVLGQGDVTIRDTTLEGGTSALHIAGDGSVNASATTFRGAIVELGNGDLVGLGKNRYDD